ncbi:hypothetical protein Syn7502_00928 [Synechococcus sp. PCC 7502]|uniref:DUF362 domain-containing protein n=1 Tax=Synechococcus sp. PCC 7502 TaxID=1173263 RepID=UPI00029FFF25|nr:DUF362 domain-containing protein [Synechococcus sp. PCC 7502]AFY73046.1 hypothetical protein Syn7502_00928 [Synechococcus sp. PCC 7502]
MASLNLKSHLQFQRDQAVNVADTKDFVYAPPQQAIAAKRILVKPNLGYPNKAPVTVSIKVLAKVLQGLRAASPDAEILIVEGVCSALSLREICDRQGVGNLLDEGMQVLDADTLPCKEYQNLQPNPVRFKTMLAPTLLEEVDCRITVGAFKRTILKDEPLISASLKNLYGLFPRSHYKARSPNSRGQLHRPSVSLILQDVYFCIGHLFDGAVVDGDRKLESLDWKPDKGKSVELGKVFWGNDPISVDRKACELGGEKIPSYLEAIDNLRQKLN